MSGITISSLFILSITLVCVYGNALAPENHCNRDCTKQFDPVCATNGDVKQIFMNECTFHVKLCTDNQEWKLLKLSECLTFHNVAEEISKIFSKPNVKCPVACPLIYQPICGYNGSEFHVFENKCVMDSVTCILENSEAWKETRMMDCMFRNENAQ